MIDEESDTGEEYAKALKLDPTKKSAEKGKAKDPEPSKNVSVKKTHIPRQPRLAPLKKGLVLKKAVIESNDIGINRVTLDPVDIANTKQELPSIRIGKCAAVEAAKRNGALKELIDSSDRSVLKDHYVATEETPKAIKKGRNKKSIVTPMQDITGSVSSTRKRSSRSNSSMKILLSGGDKKLIQSWEQVFRSS